jgi:tetratricopeptide (TPR) repeat protein
MAEVTLSKYCDEAKELIRSDSYDQAIAICRHILKHHPKYLRAYRLLGEACLEKGDYVEAANFFKRVLGSDMEDMVVYVGLGIIFDEQSALDEAIWQLEQAFELSPGNAEIRGELQRLYGDRDGAPPPKLKLTSAALGRLYLREELYQRAIDEFRGVLEEDPKRSDIQIALAQALWWSDQRQEAAKACEGILETYPNCLKANLILGEILLSSGREEEGEALLETAQAMDPENVVAQELFREESPLSPESVTVPRLDDTSLKKEIEDLRSEMPSPVGGTERGDGAPPYRPREGPEEVMPDWLRSLQEEERESAGEELTSPPESQVMPDWLQQLAHERAAEGVEAQEPGMAAGPGDETFEETEGQLPDQPLEEHLEAGEEEETAARVPGETLLPGREITPGESALIDELRLPEEEFSEAFPEEKPWQAESGEDFPSAHEAPDWLSELRMEATAADEEAPGAEPDEDETPEWLRDLRAEGIEDKAVPEPDEDVPAWLRDLRPEAAEEEAKIDEGEALDRDAAPAAVEPGKEPEPRADVVEAGPPLEVGVEEIRTPIEEQPKISDETMEHLRATMPDESDSIEEIMAWMEASKTLLADEGVTETTIAEHIEAVSRDSDSIEEGEIPTWLRQLSPTPEASEDALLGDEAEEPSQEAAVPTPEEEIPPWLLELRPETPESVAPAIGEETEEAPGEGLTAQEEDEFITLEEAGAIAEQAPTTPPEEKIPTWLLRLRADETEEEAPVPSEEPQIAPEEATAPPHEEEMPSWIDQLGEEAAEEVALPSAEAEAGGEKPVVPPPTDEEVPSWLRELRAEAMRDEPAAPAEEPEPTVEEPAPPPTEEEEMPSWLSQLQAEAARDEIPLPTEEVPLAQEEPEPHEVEAEFPSWLQELRAEVAREGAAISPEEIPTGPEAEPIAPIEPAEMPSWLSKAGAEAEAGAALAREEPEITPGEVPHTPLEEEEVPSWLRELRTQAADGDTGILMQTAESAAEEVPLPALEEEELPSWLQQLRAEATEQEGVAPPMERGPRVEDAAIEEPAAWPEEEAEPPTDEYAPPPTPDKELAAPVAVTEHEQPLTAPPSEETVEETPQPEWAVEDYVQYLESNPRDQAARLALARAYSAAGDLDRAAQHYELILSYGSMVEGVKDDLETLADSAPDHLPTHELLADAYMRTGDLQKALNKYRWLRDMLAR